MSTFRENLEAIYQLRPDLRPEAAAAGRATLDAQVKALEAVHPPDLTLRCNTAERCVLLKVWRTPQGPLCVSPPTREYLSGARGEEPGRWGQRRAVLQGRAGNHVHHPRISFLIPCEPTHLAFAALRADGTVDPTHPGVAQPEEPVNLGCVHVWRLMPRDDLRRGPIAELLNSATRQERLIGPI